MTPLTDIHIIALTTNLPGPAAASHLTHLGAQVTKVEPPQGDALQRACPAWYKKLTQNQTVLTLDLKQDKDLKQFNVLLKTADVFLTTLRPKSLQKLSLDWKTLNKKYSRLCMVNIVGYPQPHDTLAAHDLTAQAKAGLLNPPEHPRLLVADILSAERVVSATLSLLLARAKNDLGHHTTLSLQDSAAAFYDTLAHHLTTPEGILGGSSPRYHLYPTASGWIALAALEDSFWKRLCEACGQKNPTIETLTTFFKAKSAQTWETWAREQDIPLVEVKTL